MPIIRAERHRWQTGSIVERGQRICLPGITDRHRIRHLGRRNHDRITVNFGVSPVPFLIFAGDGKFTRFPAFDDQPAVGMGEVELERSGQVLHRSIGRTLIGNLFAIGFGQRTIG